MSARFGGTLAKPRFGGAAVQTQPDPATPDPSVVTPSPAAPAAPDDPTKRTPEQIRADIAGLPWYERLGKGVANSANAIGEGLSYNMLNNAQAGEDWLVRKGQNALGTNDQPLAFSDALAKRNAQTDTARDEMNAVAPGSYDALSGASSFLTGAPEIKAVKALPWAGKALYHGAVGGVGAGMNAYGEGKNWSDIGHDAAVGAGLGGALSSAGSVADEAYNWLRPASKYPNDQALLDAANKLRGRARMSKANQQIVAKADQLEDFNIAASKGKSDVGDLANTWQKTLQGAKANNLKFKEFPYSVDEITAANKFANPSNVNLADRVASAGQTLQGGIAGLPLQALTKGIPYGIGTAMRVGSNLIPRSDLTKPVRTTIRSFADAGMPTRDTLSRLFASGGLAYNRDYGGQ